MCLCLGYKYLCLAIAVYINIMASFFAMDYKAFKSRYDTLSK